MKRFDRLHSKNDPTPLWLLIGCALLQATFAQADEVANDWLIMPGVRIGSITAVTSEAMLGAAFGEANIERADIYLGEGLYETGTAVYSNDPERRLDILWRDEARSKIKEIRLTGDASVWKTIGGISLGTTLKEIERLNGYPFRLAGFGFDYGGTLVHCGRGRLSMLGRINDKGKLEGRALLLRLAPPGAARQSPDYRQVLRDREFSSGHPGAKPDCLSNDHISCSLARPGCVKSEEGVAAIGRLDETYS